MNSPKVSVIIPVYNTEKYLQRCIDSLLNQSYKDVEFIFVDDGSTDESYSFLLKTMEKDTRIKAFHQENHGASAARNFGIKQSKGDYLLFCDSDDTVEPEWCKSLLMAIEENPDSWIVCGIRSLDEWGKVQYENGHKDGAEKIEKTEYFTLLEEGLTGSVNNKIFDLNKLQKEKIFFDENRKRGEDVKFCLDYLEISKDIVTLDKILYNYFHFTTTVTLTNQYHSDNFKVLQDLFNQRDNFIPKKYKNSFRRFYWNLFYNELSNTMLYNESSMREKFRLNKKIVRSKEFQELLQLFGREEMHIIAFQFLAHRIYIGYWIVQILYRLKKDFKL